MAYLTLDDLSKVIDIMLIGSLRWTENCLSSNSFLNKVIWSQERENHWKINLKVISHHCYYDFLRKTEKEIERERKREMRGSGMDGEKETERGGKRERRRGSVRG